MYIVKSAALVSAVQRNHKIISFDPFLTAAANRMAGISGPGLELLRETQSGGGGINMDVLRSMHPALLGPGLDIMNKNMISELLSSVKELAASGGKSVDLHYWCREAITVASTKAVWGPQNPYQSAEIRKAFW